LGDGTLTWKGSPEFHPAPLLNNGIVAWGVQKSTIAPERMIIRE